MDKTLQITADFQVGPDVKYTNILGRFISTACLRLNYKVFKGKSFNEEKFAIWNLGIFS
jgi:hypothetical protein